jgi:hypothetical protein
MTGGPQVAPAWVTFTKANVPVKGATVLAKDLTGGCTDQYTLQGVTDAVSGTIKFSLPYGSWQFVVTSFSPAATYTSASNAVVLTPTTPTPAAATTVNFP